MIARFQKLATGFAKPAFPFRCPGRQRGEAAGDSRFRVRRVKKSTRPIGNPTRRPVFSTRRVVLSARPEAFPKGSSPKCPVGRATCIGQVVRQVAGSLAREGRNG